MQRRFKSKCIRCCITKRRIIYHDAALLKWSSLSHDAQAPLQSFVIHELLDIFISSSFASVSWWVWDYQVHTGTAQQINEQAARQMHMAHSAMQHSRPKPPLTSVCQETLCKAISFHCWLCWMIFDGLWKWLCSAVLCCSPTVTVRIEKWEFSTMLSCRKEWVPLLLSHITRVLILFLKMGVGWFSILCIYVPSQRRRAERSASDGDDAGTFRNPFEKAAVCDGRELGPCNSMLPF